MAYVIEVKNLVKRYKKAQENAVDGISFTVRPGEFFAFLGPNGAGKTTTISILTTTLGKTSGSVQIAGVDIDKGASRVRQRVGIIFQNPSLDINLTGEENIRIHSILYGLYSFRPGYSLMPAEYKKRVQELADVIGIGKDLFRRTKTYSGGMKRKLEIIRSLMHDPEILFLDEPTSGLDPASRHALWEYLDEVRKTRNTTVFLTTHYLDEAESVDTVCVINKGKIVALGSPADIKRELTEEYLILDAQNRAELRRELAGIGVPFREDGVFHVALDGHTAQDIIKRIDTSLSVLKVHNPTLEEAYLDVINKP